MRRDDPQVQVASSRLFAPLALRGLLLANRIVVSPMCQYSSRDGLANDWHFVHLGSRAVGGAGLVMTEATAVSAEGRITREDLGLWSDAHAEALAPVVRFIAGHGAHAGVQLAHAGRKASVTRPWEGNRPLVAGEGSWQVVGASPIPFGEGYPVPMEMDAAAMAKVAGDFAAAARRAAAIGFRAVELHMAHGYLLHSFLSPISNRRGDAYGGSLKNRMRFPLEVAAAVRAAWPQDLPLFVRISATDWTEGGWDIEQSVAFCRHLKEVGVDLVDCSSGGIAAGIAAPQTPGFQVPFAARVRREAALPTAAVGLITTPAQAEAILARGEADMVFLAKAMLRDPYWAIRAAEALGAPAAVPDQYGRAAPFLEPA